MTYETCPDCGSVGRHHYAHCLLGDQPRVEIADVLDDSVESKAVEERMTLEVGKFYRRKDGRKFGPVWFKNNHCGIAGAHYTPNGLYAHKGVLPRNEWDEKTGVEEMDLVAEWADETIIASPDVKSEIADEAKRIVSGARRSAYGKPEQNFERIARYWDAYFKNTGRDANITAADVSPLMRLMKEARLNETLDHRDSFVDLVGYALTGAEVNQVKATNSA